MSIAGPWAASGPGLKRGYRAEDGLCREHAAIGRSDSAYLDYTLAITDPNYLSGVVTLEKRWINLPGTRLLPYNCAQ